MMVANSDFNRQEASAPAAPQSGALLSTKLFIPRPRSTLVARPRLMTRLEAGLRGPLTVLAAPAGWGKTTVLAEWLAESAALERGARSVAWVSLDAGDNDPVRFWTYALTALDSALPGIAADALALLRARQPLPIETVLAPLLNALAVTSAEAREVILVLDDYHVITSGAVHAAVGFLLDHLPPRLHVVIGTREDPELPLARRRAQGTVTELRAADLRFTLEETASFLAAALGTVLLTESISALEAHSEGWVAGLQLAALSMQGRSREQVETFIAAFSGSTRYIADYLIEEVLARQPAAVQDFVLRTAVLDRFCAPLCERLLADTDREGADGSAPAGPPSADGEFASASRPHAQPLLEQVERANLFLIPLDDERRWYRYHHLFADALRARLRQSDAVLHAELHRRASEWFEEQGLIEEAVAHALAGAAFVRAADLIERHGAAVGTAGRAETVLGWLRALPAALVRARPQLCACHALVHYYLSGQAAVAVEAVEAVEAHLREADAAVAESRRAGATEEQLRPVLGELALVRALVAVTLGDFAASTPLAQQALDWLPQTDTVWRAIAQYVVCQSYKFTGEVRGAAAQRLAERLDAVRAAGDLQLTQLILMDLGHLQRLQGRRRLAAATYEEANRSLPVSLQLEHLRAGPFTVFDLATGRLEVGELDEAERLLARGMRMLAQQGGTARTVTLGYLTLACLRQARGDATGALATLDTFAELAMQRRFAAAWPARGAALRAQLQLAQGDLAAAIAWAGGCVLSADDAEVPFVLEPAYLALVRVRIAQGRNDQGGPYLTEAERLLSRLLVDAQVKERGRSVLEILILRALALQARRDTRGAMSSLAQALALAQPEGYVRLFADEGMPMAALLTELLAAARQRRLAVPPALLDYATFLLAACRAPEGSSSMYHAAPNDATTTSGAMEDVPPLPLLDPLTEREVEVLSLLADGAPNAEIAAALVVGVGTVKKHVYNVCRKLGVQNRTQAVARARTLHLL
jgi:LuxR family maltose regulon positive regulatory protein